MWKEAKNVQLEGTPLFTNAYTCHNYAKRATFQHISGPQQSKVNSKTNDAIWNIEELSNSNEWSKYSGKSCFLRDSVKVYFGWFMEKQRVKAKPHILFVFALQQCVESKDFGVCENKVTQRVLSQHQGKKISLRCLFGLALEIANHLFRRHSSICQA